MDRKNHRASNGGVATASVGSTPRLLQSDEVPDEVTLWTMTLQELVRVAELQDTNTTLAETLEKNPEGEYLSSDILSWKVQVQSGGNR